MSISTYSELQTKVLEWSHRTDLATVVPDCITFCENMLNYGDDDLGISALRTASMETAYTGATVANTTQVALPNDFLEWRRLRISVDGVLSDLEQVALTPTGFDEITNVASIPDRYTIVGENMEMRPKPDAVYALDGVYYAAIPALSDSNTTNWLLTKAPNAYLYGSLFHLSIHMGGLGMQWRDTWLAGCRAAVNQVVKQDRRKRFSTLKRRTDLGTASNRSARLS